MTVARDQHTDNVVLGAGEIFIDRYNASGDPTGVERYLGDSVGGTISVTSERTTIQSGDGAVAQDLVDIIRSVSRTIGFTLHDMSLENWSLFVIGGDPEEVTVSANEVTDESFGAVKAGETVTLGLSADRPSGVGEVGDGADAAASGKTTIKDGSTAKKLVRGNAAQDPRDAILDVKAGRITALKDFVDLKVTYTPTAKKVNVAKATKETKQITCAIRYIEDAASGKGRNVYIRKCNLVPSGEMAMKSRDTEQQMAFTGTVVEPAGDFAFISIDDTPLTAS